VRAPAAREAGCVLDLIAELTLEGPLGDVQIVVSVKEAGCTDGHVGQVKLFGCHVARWRSRSAIVSMVGWPAATSITRS
jgi:hypothetical protein